MCFSTKKRQFVIFFPGRESGDGDERCWAQQSVNSCNAFYLRGLYLLRCANLSLVMAWRSSSSQPVPRETIPQIANVWHGSGRQRERERARSRTERSVEDHDRAREARTTQDDRGTGVFSLIMKSFYGQRISYQRLRQSSAQNSSRSANFRVGPDHHGSGQECESSHRGADR